MESPIILHHYWGSPFSQKIVWALTIKKLKWTSVTVSPVLPRPLLQPLTHGYRRIPVLQIGSDVFIDTALILEELERSSKDPSVPKGFSSKKFIDDRSSLYGSPIDVEKLSLKKPDSIDKIRPNFELIELQFSNDNREWFLDTPYPSISDIHVAMNIWFLGFTQGAKEIADPKLYPKTYSWLNRFLKYIKLNEIKPEKISSQEALEIAKKFKPFNQGKMNIEQDKNDRRKLGDNVIIIPNDYGKIPVKGKIVSLSNRIIGIRPHNVDNTGIEVVTWFPRAGYVIKPDNGKL